MCVHAHLHTCPRASTYMLTYIHMDIYIHMYIDACIYAYILVCTHIHMCVRVLCERIVRIIKHMNRFLT